MQVDILTDIALGANMFGRGRTVEFSRRPCEHKTNRSRKHLSKSPAFKNAPAGAVGYNAMFGASADRQLQEACATEIVCPTLTKTTFASAVWNATRGRGSIRITLSNRHSPTLTEPRSIATDDQTTLPNRHPPASTGTTCGSRRTLSPRCRRPHPPCVRMVQTGIITIADTNRWRRS